MKTLKIRICSFFRIKMEKLQKYEYYNEDIKTIKYILFETIKFIFKLIGVVILGIAFCTVLFLLLYIIFEM